MGNTDCGCSNRGGLNLYEYAIAIGERKFGWQNKKAQDLILAFKQVSKRSQVNRYALRLALQHADLPTDDIEDKYTIVGSFFLTLLEITGLGVIFKEQDLCLMAIVLGKGSTFEKATELFEYFDTECSQKLSREQLAHLFTEYSTTIAIILPLLGAGNYEDGLLHIEEIKKYQRGMNRNMIDVHAAFMGMMMNSDDTETTQESFVRKLSTTDLLTSVGLRRFVLKHGGFARRPKSNFLKEQNPLLERILSCRTKDTGTMRKLVDLERQKSRGSIGTSSTGTPKARKSSHNMRKCR